MENWPVVCVILRWQFTVDFGLFFLFLINPGVPPAQMKLRRRCMQTLGVSIKQLRKKLLELGARILHFQASSPCDMALVMLTVSAGMEVGSGGHRGGLGGGLDAKSAGVESMHQDAMVAAARDRAIRAGSVRHDLALDLPPRLQLPDGEERPYGAQAGLHLRDPEQESEIYQKCVRPPPNRTIFDSESPPPYRSQSGLLDTQERIVRCHSAGSSLLRVFRKFPTSSNNNNNNSNSNNNNNNNSGAVPTVVVPQVRRTTLSSYSDSSGNLSNLSSLTVVPCEADETSSQQQQQQHHHHHHHHHHQQNSENV